MPSDDELAAPPGPELERDLLSTVCHDLKAPLASIVMGAGLLARTLPEDAAAMRVVDAIKRAADQMNRLVTSFGDLGRLQSGAMRLERRPLDPAEVVRAAYDAFVADAARQGVPSSVDCHPSLAGTLVTGDRERLAQALRLLASCALRMVPEGGAIAITLAPEGASARFAVAASRAARGRPFGRDLARPELAIARGLVELHGSRLEVQSGTERLELAFVLPRESSARTHPTSSRSSDAF